MYFDTSLRSVAARMAQGKTYQYPLDKRLQGDHCYSVGCGGEKNLTPAYN
jgi:hypothetical protein